MAYKIAPFMDILLKEVAIIELAPYVRGPKYIFRHRESKLESRLHQKATAGLADAML